MRTPEQKERQSARQKVRRASPEYKAKENARRRERYAFDAEYKDRILRRTSGRNRTERGREIHAKANKKYSSTPEFKARRREYSRQYEAARRKTIQERRAAHRSQPKVKEARADYQREYRSSPEGKALAASLSHKRRVRALATFHPDSTEAILKLKSKKTVRCFYCHKRISGKAAEIDHVNPLALGGAHAAFNLVPACSDCNRHKNAKPPNEFIQAGKQQVLVF